MAERLGDDPITAQFRTSMNRVAEALDEVFNGEARGQDRKVGFVLLTYLFDDGDKPRVNFISNGAKRSDLVVMFKELIARFEGQAPQSGSA